MTPPDDAFPPACVVRSLVDARAVLAPGLPVTLLSPPGAGQFAGPLWWRALVAEAMQHAGAPPMRELLDCGDAPGRALEALRLGQCALILLAAPPLVEAVRARAGPLGARVLDRRPPALDLAPFHRRPAEASRRLLAWLAPGSNNRAPASLSGDDERLAPTR